MKISLLVHCFSTTLALRFVLKAGLDAIGDAKMMPNSPRMVEPPGNETPNDLISFQSDPEGRTTRGDTTGPLDREDFTPDEPRGIMSVSTVEASQVSTDMVMPSEDTTTLGPAQGDKKFIRKLINYRDALYPDGKQLDQRLLRAIRTNSPVLFGEDRAVSWFPVQCSVMGINLRMISVLQSSKVATSNAVYKVKDEKTGKVYAYKLFGKAEDYSAEIGFFMVANHPMIVKPVCIQRERKGGKGRAGLLMEFVEGESSQVYAKRSSTTKAQLTKLSAQLLVALKYMHKIGFVHGDLKADNIIVTPSGDLVVIDFGYSVPFPYSKPNRGNPAIKAPELAGLIDAVLDEALDMWAYGAVLATWFYPKYYTAGKKPYSMMRIGHHRNYVFNSVPIKFPTELRAILYLCLSPNTALRRFRNVKTLQFLKGMVFFADIDWEEVETELIAGMGMEN